MKAVFFEGPSAFRAWLEENHTTRDELFVGFYRRATGKPSMTWSESVDEALCFGWIDGIRHRIDEERYSIRFTPRRRGSHWSRVNLDKVAALREAGRMAPAGLTAYERRDPAKSGLYSFEGEAPRLDAEYEREFRKRKRAWSWFESRPPGYRSRCIGWVMSAKREATRRRRLGVLIECSAEDRKIPLLGG